ncbi:MAG: T9SS type A sorting domain-containing protein, partial [Flavobacteriales bacterium]|nr:T9SS type A sorting domain-containing protein [Flavobacteriales bacterium]
NNYSATLVGWYVNNPNVTDRTLGAGGMEYGTFAAIARDSLVYARGWDIQYDSPSDALCNGLLSSDELAHPNEPDILIYPNPTPNRVIINAPPSALERVSILNSQGKDVTSKTTMRDKSNGEKEIDLSSLNAGIYFVRTATATEIVVKR